MRGSRFTREQTRTGAVWPGGDRPPPPPRDPDQRFCHVLQCLLKQRGIWELLRKNGIDAAQLAKCLEGVCSRGRTDDALRNIKSLVSDERLLKAIAAALQAHEGEHD